MAELKIISLRQFREKAAEITEEVQIAVRDQQGNLRILGVYKPYMTHPPGAVDLPIERERVEEAMRVPGARDKIIRTPAEAAAAAPQSVRPFPKSAQTGRKKR